MRSGSGNTTAIFVFFFERDIVRESAKDAGEKRAVGLICACGVIYIAKDC